MTSRSWTIFHLFLISILFLLATGDFKHEHLVGDGRKEMPGNSVGESDYDYDEGNYDENQWGETFGPNDTQEVSEIEREEEIETEVIYPQSPSKRSRISKCCPFGEGLSAQGNCKHHDFSIHQPTSWFPDRVIDFERSSWLRPNEAEWEVTAPKKIICRTDESSEVLSDTNRFAILTNGKLFLAEHGKELSPDEYCVDLLMGKGTAVKSCFSQKDLCRKADCLRKCCPEGSMVDENQGNCYFHSFTRKNNFTNDKYNVIHGSPTCPDGQYTERIEGYFNIGKEGNLITPNALNVSFLNYCLDFFIDRSPNGKDSEVTILPVLKAILCFESKRMETSLIQVPREMSIAYGLAFLLSAISIALAALISWRLPELRSLHGKCQLSHLGTLFLLFLLLAVIHLGSTTLVSYTTFCTFLAVSLHTATLSAFLWLNLLCLNIYLTFRSLRPPLAARRDERKRLICLSLYAWGIPIAFCIFLYILDKSPGRLEPMPRPHYGEASCLISNRLAMAFYLYGPVGFLLLLNGVLFCLTARELLCGLWRLDNSDSLSFRRKSMGIVVAKLGIVMGMGWILDVLSWAIGQEPYIFYIADLFNGLQGVFMFLVLIWRKRVLEVLKLKKPSIMKDETLTARPFLPSKSNIGGMRTNGDPDTSLALLQEP